MRAGSPPKNAAAATWAATHSVWSMTRVGGRQTERRLAGTEAVLGAQALVDRGEVVGGQGLLDGLVMGGALGEGGGAQLGDDQLREPAPHVERPLLGGDRRAPGSEAGFLRRCHVLAQRLAVNPERLRHDELGPARVPVLEDLHDVDHFERPPYLLGSFRPVDARSVGGSESGVADFRPPAPGWGIP